MKKRPLLGLAVSAALVSGGILGGCSPAATEPASGDSGTSPEPAAEESATRTVTDSDGNEATIPATVERVAPTMGAFAQVTEMLGQGNGKIAAASTQQISDAFKAVFTDYDQSNPNGYDSKSVEDLIAAGVQVLYGPNTGFSDEQLAQLDAAGIAYVKLANIATVDGLCESILTIGEILGDEEAQTAEEFVDYYRASLSDAERRAASIPDDQRKTVLQLSNSGGVYTCTAGDDISAEYYRAAGAVNVAEDYESPQSGEDGMVDAEQIVAWNPEVIIAMNSTTRDEVMADPALAGVTAVKNGEVYVCPTALYLWCVRSAEGALMTPWLGTVIYPDQFSDVNMTEVLQDFYQRWYGTDLPDEDAQRILAGETGTQGRGGR